MHAGQAASASRVEPFAQRHHAPSRSSKDMRGVDALWSELRRFAGTGESVSEEE
ncbi:MAG: hypothetical protein ACLSAH_03740 [Bilophila wadsworthia]